MKIEVRARGVELDGQLGDYVERSLRFALGRFSSRARLVRVRLEDLNGPKGGVDKRCVVTVSGDGFERCVVDVRDTTVQAAVDQAAGIASRAVARALERARDLSGGRKRPLPRFDGWARPAPDASPVD
jgi:hypothetical protein